MALGSAPRGLKVEEIVHQILEDIYLENQGLQHANVGQGEAQIKHSFY